MCRYPPSTIHRYLDLPSTQKIQTHTEHIHNTTPPLPTLVQVPYILPTYTTHTTATKIQAQVQHSPCPGKAQTQFSHPLSTNTAPSQIGCTRQDVGSLHSLETTSHSLQQTYLRLLIHTTQNFKWSTTRDN